MEFRVLGPVEVASCGQPAELGGARARSVLAVLLVQAGQLVPADLLADQLWPGQPADRAAASLQVRISGLRRALRGVGADGRLVTRPPGYLLQVEPGELDADQFDRLTAAAREALAEGDAAGAVGCLDQALALWRGPALAGADDAAITAAAAGRLEEARRAAREARAEALLACGRHREAIAGLDALTAECPLRERPWALRMLALYRTGRQADALAAYRDLRGVLAAELGIEPGREPRDLHARILRQDPGLDPGPVLPAPRLVPDRTSPHGASQHGASRPERPPPTRYARTADGIHIAYQVLGSGERDIVFVPGLMSHLDLVWEDPETAAFYRRLATLGRLILFDKRDTGLSDRAPGDCSLAERMTDMQAVMAAAGSRRAVLFGYSEGAPMSILFAATYPGKVTALILGSASARWFPAPGYPCGAGTQLMFDALWEIGASRWGQGDTIDWYLPSQAGSPRAREMLGRFERMAISPSAFLRMLRMIRDIDVRAALPRVTAPTLVIQRLGDRITPPAHGRYLAEHIPGARYFEQPGDHSLRFAGSGDGDALFGQVAAFLAESPGPQEPGPGSPTSGVPRSAAGSGPAVPARP
jgi:DNA-binding SARP family transcriptional activator/pimeloyl-ACP methyl ester carboxylesterase